MHLYLHSFLFSLLFSIFSTSLSAQSGFKFYDEVTVPQTDAWSFIRQGDISPSLYTGTINLSIPIYTYQDRDFTLPIAANYSSNGNTPNQLAGWLGPGWNLTVGGCITVETRGIPDYGANVKGVLGFYSVHSGPISTTQGSVWMNSHQPDKWWRFMRNINVGYGSGTSAPEINLVTDYNNNKPNYQHTYEYDAQPDIFHFSLPGGHSGTFHLGFQKEIIVYNTSSGKGADYKIEIEEQALSTTNPTRFKSITITTSDGFRYIFNGEISSPSVDMSKSRERTFYDLISAWHLTRIEAPNGRWAEFSYSSYEKRVYSPGNAMTTGSVSDNQMYIYIGGGQNNSECYSPTGLGDEDGRSSWRDTRSSMLNSITFSDGSHIDFTTTTLATSEGDQYCPDLNLSPTNYSNTKRLSSINVYIGTNTQSVASASFTHKRNTNGAKTTYLASIVVQGEGTYSFDYYGWNDSSKPYPPHNCYGVDHWGYYNGKNGEYYPTSYIDPQTQSETISGESRNPDANYARLGMLTKITYPTGGWSILDYEPHSCSIAVDRSYNTNSLNSFVPRIIAYNGSVGGLRIKKIDSYLANGTLSLSKEYSYTDALGNSSGILTWVPRYSISFSCQASSTLTENSTYRSSSLQDYGFTNVEYRSVVELIKDSCRIVNIFTSSADGEGFIDTRTTSNTTPERALLSNGTISSWSPNTINPQSLLSAHQAVAPLTSFHSQRGKIRERRVYKSPTTHSPSQIETIEYQQENAFTPMPCYLIREFGTYDIFIGKYLPSVTTKKVRADNQLSEEQTNTLFTYNNYGEIISIKEIKSGTDTLITEYLHLRDLSTSQINGNVVYKTMKRKNILSLPLEEKIYLKSAGSSQKQLIEGRICQYAIFTNSTDTLILPSYIDSYDKKTSSWKREISFTSYDSYGNIKELYDSQRIPTSYLWSSDGQELVLQAKGITQQQITQLSQSNTSPQEWSQIPFSVQALRNAYPLAEITAIEPIPGIGPARIEDIQLNNTYFTYTRWGKLKYSKFLKHTSSASTDNLITNNYSNDN